MSLKKKVVWLPYDFDTALGINNEGELTFGYELEDTDHLQSGADVYNGQSSVVWNNLRDAFGSELAEMYKNLRTDPNGTGKYLSYDKVEQMFEEHQDKWPEAIFNEDSWFKYILPLTEDGANYLYMLQGSKEEQRKWWLYNRFRYMDSKYNAGDAVTDYISLRAYAKSDITVTPYADIYPSVKFGSYLVQRRGQRNVATTLECPLTNPNDTETQIYSASQLADVGDLSGLKPGKVDISKATKLQRLIIGSSASGYTNGNLAELTIGNNVLLQSIDARNSTALTQAVDASGCANIQEVYFDGTAITGLTLPNGGVLRVLHLPGTVANLTIMNQTGITDFTMPSYANITTLRLENVSSAINEIAILNQIQSGSRVRLIDFTWSFTTVAQIEAVLDILDTMRGLDVNGNTVETAQVAGTIYIPNMTGSKLSELQARYPRITYTYDHITTTLNYYNYDGSSLIYTEQIVDGGNGTYTGTPSRTSTAQYSYTFVGWSRTANSTTADSTATQAVTTDRSIYAAYTATLRTYPVYYYNGTVLLQTVEDVPFGGSATYTGATPVYNGSEAGEWVFNGFSPTGANITGATSCYAQYYDNSSATTMFLKGSLTTYTSSANTTIGQYAFAEASTLTSATVSATTVGTYAFTNCTNLTTVDLTSTSATTIAAYAFNGCSSLTAVIIRSTSMSTLSNVNAFTGTQITIGNGAIYVPSALVSTYKANSNWANFLIYSIDDYPVTDFSTISDSWTTINSALANGTFTGSVGDTKLLTFGDYSCYMELVGLQKDNLADGSGKAKSSWLGKGIFTTKRMNASNVTTDGWAESEIRTWLRETILPTFPAELQSVIKPVTKAYYDYGDSAVETITDTVWIASLEEVNGVTTGNYHAETSGVVYSDKFTSNTNSAHASRIKYNTSGSANLWWLRSAFSAASFDYVSNSGNISNSSATYTYGVVLGFCI